MSIYADASFLYSLYALDGNSRRAKQVLTRATPPLILSDLGQLEFLNALRLGLYRRDLRTDEVDELERLFHQDLAVGTLIVRPVNSAAYVNAIELARKYTPTLNVRTLDILHVACALTLGMQTFFTFDHRQAKLAAATGLRTF